MGRRSRLIAVVAVGLIGAAGARHGLRRPRPEVTRLRWHSTGPAPSPDPPVTPAATWGPPVTADAADIVARVEAYVGTPSVAGLDAHAHESARAAENGFPRRVQAAPRAQRRVSGTALVVAACVLALVALGLGSWALVQELRDPGSDEATARAAVVERSVALLADPSTQRIPISGSGPEAVLAVGAEGNALLVLDGLAQAPEGRAYEAWVIPAGGKVAVPAGIFQGTERVVELGRRVGRGATVAVTLERSEGVEAPTQSPKLVAKRP